MRRLALALTLLVLTAGAGFAADTPEAVVTRQLEAMKAGDWEKFASCMRDQDLKEIQTTVIGLLDAPESPAREQLRSLFDDKPTAELKTVSAATFFGKFMTGIAQFNPAIKQGAATAEGQVLGHVDEGPDKTHVLMRMTMSVADGKVTKMDVTTLEREGNTWKALLKDNMRAIVTNLTKMLQSK